uniref:Inositol polyphosphate-related phosphatase domain-containing protein n=1 Tax=Alexandrium andersonii TaxID=327968 RepID=A0A7S2FMP2_9DINO
MATRPKHHVYVVGTCECERSIERSMVWGSKTRWEQQVRSHLGEDYFMIGSHNMSAVHVMVFLHRYLWKFCWDIKTAQVATGFGNLIGNKGGTQVGFRLGRTSVLFVNAHLAAHAGKMKERTQSLARILVDSPMRKDKEATGVHDQYDRVFFMGDLNPRLNAKRSDVDTWLADQEFEKCLERDQLLPLLHSDPAVVGRGEGTAGMWPLFEEAAIRFPPTYKFDTHTDQYDSSKKQRVPSWTDRILWKRDSRVRSLAYGSVTEMRCSDHRPVFAQFEVEVDLDNWEGPGHPPGSKKSSVCVLQ